MIYTSYFANYRKFPEEATPVSIALHPPAHWRGENNLLLAPDYLLLNDWKAGKLTIVEYTKRYIALLDAMPITVTKILTKYDEENRILLCYEKEGFCHRHLLKMFIRQHKLGIKVQEF